MLSNFKLQTLKQKLWAIVAASFVARVIMFFVLPNTPSSLAPDEGTYALLTKWIGDSNPANLFPIYGERLYLSGRAIIYPASLLYRAGLDELTAARLISSLYGFSALVLIVVWILKVFNIQKESQERLTRNEKLISALVLIFAFIPSHFLWSNLALRESSTEFWVIATFMAFLITYSQQKKITVVGLFSIFASIVLTFSSRPQVGWVLGVSLVSYLILNLRNPLTYFLIPIVIGGVLFGATLNTVDTAVDTAVDTRRELSELFSPLVDAGEVVSTKHLNNQEYATSVIETQSCPRETTALASSPSTKFDTYFCIAWRAPYMVSTFLFRPILGLDATSTSSLLAAFENLAWVSFFLIIFGLLIRRRRITFLNPLLPTLIFLSLYVLGASAYQGNMGTGFRHKSLILWAVLLVIFALAWRKLDEPMENPQSNSQENAV